MDDIHVYISKGLPIDLRGCVLEVLVRIAWNDGFMAGARANADLKPERMLILEPKHTT